MNCRTYSDQLCRFLYTSEFLYS